MDLLKRKNFTDPKICGYLNILEEKANRLKILTEDVVEASKASTGNISLEGTCVYAEMLSAGKKVSFSLKNISAQPLNFSAEELSERFIRGDVSRNTEGSGLGLSIAKSLTELQGGEFSLYLDGDLFKVTITFAAK